MAIRFTAASNQYLSASVDLSYNSAYTALWRYYRSTDTGVFENQVTLWSDSSNNDYTELSLGDTFESAATLAGSGTYTGPGPVASIGTWYNVAMIRDSATAIRLVVNGTEYTQTMTSVSARSAMTTLYVGAWGISTDYCSGRVSGLQFYNRALTATEVQSQFASFAPKLPGCTHFWPLQVAGNYTDLIGGTTLTATNIPTTEDGPPVPWGSQSPLTSDLWRPIWSTLR